MCYIFLFYNVGGVDVAVQVNIDDNKIDNFSDGAQTTLKKQMEKYADDIIKEANLIEEAIREDGANTEITSNIERIKVIRVKNLIGFYLLQKLYLRFLF